MASAGLMQDSLPAPNLAIRSTSPANEPELEAALSLVVYCLGTFRVYQGDRLITDWNGQKGKSIFKYLLAHRETPVAKEILMDLFWPGVDPESARRSLHQAIYSLRQALRRGNPDFSHVYFENDCYLLNPEMALWVDRVEFEKHLQAGRRLEAANQITEAIVEYGIAESLYQGDYLEEDLYEDWPAVEREHLRRTYCELADRLSEHYVRNGEYNAAIALCQKILERDNCHEPAYRRLMRCYLAQGQRHLAIRQYQTCVELLQEELEIGPSEETEALVQRIINTR
jgi:DNA-binding SARP family transcriptional activator